MISERRSRELRHAHTLYLILTFIEVLRPSRRTYKGLFGGQSGRQRVSTAGPKGEKTGSSRDGHRGEGGHLLVHEKLLQGRIAPTQHRHGRRRSTNPLDNEVCNSNKSLTSRRMRSHQMVVVCGALNAAQ